MEPPPGELETPLQLTVVIEELPHDRCLRAWGDGVDRLPLACAIVTGRDVGVQKPGAVELKSKPSTHRGLLGWSTVTLGIRDRCKIRR